MSSNTKRPQTARQQTDHSLLVEREKTDAEIEKRERIGRGRSDSVVDLARERADELLAEARSKADALKPNADPHSSQAAVDTERAVEDSRVQEERVRADRQLETERTERLRALNALLRFERDQTDERLLVERARSDASLLARDNFMTMVAHDVRTLLGAIALTAGLQVQHPGSDEAGRQNLARAQKIQRLTARINRLMGDLFDVTSIEAGRFSVDPTSQDARPLIAEAVEAFAVAASAKGLTLELSPMDTVLTARLDHDRIFQVLANLLSNSIKFTAAGGRLSVRAGMEREQLHVSVSDTGQGVASDRLEAIFERFWQVQKDRRGLGLGLFISRCIVEAHGGRLWAESALGKGSTFHFTVPAREASAA